MHAWPKQTVSGTGRFAVGEGLVTANGDMHMQGEGLTTGNGDMHMQGEGLTTLTGEFPPRRLRARRQAMQVQQAQVQRVQEGIAILIGGLGFAPL